MSDVTEQPTIPAVERLEVRGGTISYRRRGTGKTTLFLHSAGGGDEWNAYHDALAEGRDLIVPDHPGFGGSDDFSSLKSIDDLVYHYLDVLDLLDLHDIDLVGCSFGGWIAAELAVHSPDRFSSLTLLAPAGLRIPEATIADIFIMSGPEVIAALYHDKDLVEMILSVQPSVDDILKLYRELGTTARFGWNPYLSNPRLEGRLHRVTARTRVIAAGEDRIVPIVHCERYAEKISGADLVVVEGVGHALYGERPDLVSQAVIEFLDN